MDRTNSTISWTDVLWSTIILTAAWTVAFSPMWWPALDRWNSSGLMAVIIGGLAIGGAQWVVTSRRFGAGAGWALAYAVGWGAGLWCGFKFGFISPNPLPMGAAGGAIVGAMQAVSLKRDLRSAASWVVASAVISIVGCWSGVAFGNWTYNNGSGEPSAYLDCSALCGLIIGFLTAIMLRALTAARNPAEAR